MGKHLIPFSLVIDFVSCVGFSRAALRSSRSVRIQDVALASNAPKIYLMDISATVRRGGVASTVPSQTRALSACPARTEPGARQSQMCPEATRVAVPWAFLGSTAQTSPRCGTRSAALSPVRLTRAAVCPLTVDSALSLLCGRQSSTF
jgi:hypothetical protein